MQKSRAGYDRWSESEASYELPAEPSPHTDWRGIVIDHYKEYYPRLNTDARQRVVEIILSQIQGIFLIKTCQLCSNYCFIYNKNYIVIHKYGDLSISGI